MRGSLLPLCWPVDGKLVFRGAGPLLQMWDWCSEFQMPDKGLAAAREQVSAPPRSLVPHLSQALALTGAVLILMMV